MHVEFVEPEPGIRLRTARWEPEGSAPARGDMLLLNGRSEYVEKYDETAGRLTGLGFRVWSIDWRGQGLSTRLLPNREKGHIDSFDAHVRDLRAFIAHIHAAGGAPRLVVAHSMGGHITFRYLIDTPDHPFERAVFSAPMIGPKFARWQAPLLPVLIRLAAHFRRLDRYALGQGDWDPAAQHFAGNGLTRDRTRFDELIETMLRRPELRLGGVTWGWLGAAAASCERLFGFDVPARLALPVLVVRAGEDTIVDNARMAAFTARLPHATLHDIVNARHEILRETDAVRENFWRAFDGFCGIGEG